MKSAIAVCDARMPSSFQKHPTADVRLHFATALSKCHLRLHALICEPQMGHSAIFSLYHFLQPMHW